MARRERNIAPEVAYVLARLKLAIQALGFSLRTIEKRLQTGDGYLSRVFTGLIELKMEHIIGIARALEMAPEELMAFVYPIRKDPISPAAYELWQRVGGLPPVAPSLAPRQAAEGGVTETDAERLLRQALGRVFGDLASTLGKEANKAS